MLVKANTRGRNPAHYTCSTFPKYRWCLNAQAEDDMVVTLNHILIYQEESELLDNRK